MHLLAKLCPEHKIEMIGGPTQFYCEIGRHTVHAADVPHECVTAHLVKVEFDSNLDEAA